MVYFQRTFVFALALFKIFLGLVTDLPSFAMARITEMMGAKAEKEGDATTETAFVINKGLLMLFTESISIITSFENIGSAFRADKLFRLMLKSFLHLLLFLVR